jgi:cold shock CspA family protein
MKGRIEFFNSLKNYGMIIRDDDNAKFIFFKNDVSIDPQEVPFDKDELIEFEHDKDNLQSKNRAVNVKRVVNKRTGKVKDFDTKKGFGNIIDKETGQCFFIHFSNIEDIPGRKIKRLYEGEDVVFEIGTNDKGVKVAVNCIQLDARAPFFRYFRFPNDYGEIINKLADISSKEDDPDWNYTHEASNYENPVLYNYLQHTLLRLTNLNYIVEGPIKKNARNYLFNVGLVNDYGEDIFALFEDDEQMISKWIFIDFLSHSNNKLMNLFGEKRPNIATYLDNPVDFVYDSRLNVIPDIEHILDTNFDRLPIEIQGKSKIDLGKLLKDRTADAVKKVTRNYRVAVPQLYDGTVQLLLPLCLNTSQKVDRALVVERRSDVQGQLFYYGSTILTLSQAYNNARLISPLDRRGWLLP